jgi:hypothetical protein
MALEAGQLSLGVGLERRRQPIGAVVENDLHSPSINLA